VEVADPEQVDVSDRHRPGVALADREGRAGDDAFDAQRAGRAPHERRLAGAEFALDEHHVARAQLRGYLGAERLGLGGAGGPHNLVLVSIRHGSQAIADSAPRWAAAKPDAPTVATVTHLMTGSAHPSAPSRLAALRQRYAAAVADLKGSDTAKAVGLAGAMIVNNVI